MSNAHTSYRNLKTQCPKLNRLANVKIVLTAVVTGEATEVAVVVVMLQEDSLLLD